MLAYLGASTDGVLVNDADTISGIIEIKCPFFCYQINCERGLYSMQ